MNWDWSPIEISLKTAAIATGLTFGLGIAAAWGLYRYRGRGRGILDGILIAPLVLPPTVVGFLLLLALGRNSGLGQALQAIGIRLIFTWQAAVVAQTVVAFPLLYRTTLGAFEQIDANLLRAARTLGSSEGEILLRVMLPLARRGIVAGTILAFARALGEFGATLMLAGNIPGQTQTIPLAIFFAAESGDFEEASVWVLLILAISLVVIWTANGCSGSGPTKRPPQDPFCQAESGQTLQVQIAKELSGFSLRIEMAADQCVGILGASGSGKSMTLRCIAGLERPDRGRILLNGRVLFDSERGIDLPCQARNIGIVFQNYALFPHLNVRENIAFGLQKLPRPERQLRVAQQIAQLKLQGLEHRYPHQLSGGQQQRVALARALVVQPEALLLDEPFSALDTHLRSQLEGQMIDLLADYSGVTLLVTHNLEEVYRLCSGLVILSAGRAIAQGSKQAIFLRPPNPESALLTGCKNLTPAEAQSPDSVYALGWQCHLRATQPIPLQVDYVGIRAHHLRFPAGPEPENTFPCWLAQMSETPFRRTLYLKLHGPASHAQDYHLQAEVSQDLGLELQAQPFPWWIQMPPDKLFLTGSSASQSQP